MKEDDRWRCYQGSLINCVTFIRDMNYVLLPKRLSIFVMNNGAEELIYLSNHFKYWEISITTKKIMLNKTETNFMNKNKLLETNAKGLFSRNVLRPYKLINEDGNNSENLRGRSEDFSLKISGFVTLLLLHTNSLSIFEIVF